MDAFGADFALVEGVTAGDIHLVEVRAAERNGGEAGALGLGNDALDAASLVDLDASPADNLKALALAKGVPVSERCVARKRSSSSFAFHAFQTLGLVPRTSATVRG